MEYSQRQIKDLLSMINAGNLPNKNRPYESANRGLHRSRSAYGIVGEFSLLGCALDPGRHMLGRALHSGLHNNVASLLVHHGVV